MTAATEGDAVTGPATVKVWDAFVRVFHWTVVVAFFIAYFTEDEVLTLHVWAGYAIGVLVVMRVIWGFIGPQHARFSDFLYRPSEVAAYARDLVGFRARRYLGHSPAGGTMVLALLVTLAATVWTGLELYAVEENAGPLAAFSAPPEAAAQDTLSGTLASSEEGAGAEGPDGEQRSEADGGGVWEELHEVLANVALVLVLIHIAGVLLASAAHRENLARAMVTGYKRTAAK